MSRDGRRRSGEPEIDLETVRETLSLIHDDMKRSTHLHRVHAALGKALEEIATLEAGAVEREPGPANGRVLAFPAFRPQFKPWTAET